MGLPSALPVRALPPACIAVAADARTREACLVYSIFTEGEYLVNIGLGLVGNRPEAGVVQHCTRCRGVISGDDCAG